LKNNKGGFYMKESSVTVFFKFFIGLFRVLLVLGVLAEISYFIIRFAEPNGAELLSPITNWLISAWNLIIGSV